MSKWLVLAFLAQAATATDLAGVAAGLDQKAAEAGLLGNYADAERHQKRALALWEEVARTRSVNLAPPHFNLAQIYVAEHRLGDAERECRLAMELSSPEELPSVTALLAKILLLSGKNLGQPIVANLQGIDLAVAANDLGMILFKSGNYREARTWLEKSVEAYRRSGNTKGPDFGRVLSNLAIICQRLGDYAAAEQWYRHALAILEPALGPNHVHVGMILTELATVEQKLGHKSEAKALSRRAKNILASSPDLPGRHTIDLSALR